METTDCSAVATCQGAKIQGLCASCGCDICGSRPPPLTIFQWKNGKTIKLCDTHVAVIDMTKIDKQEFDQIIFITS